MRSEASTVEEYLDELPEERRGPIERVRRTILDNLPEGFEEKRQADIAMQVSTRRETLG